MSSIFHEDAAHVDGIEIWIARDKTVLGTVWISDTLRPDVEKTVHAIQNLGIEKIGMVSGDAGSSVLAIAKQVGLSEKLVRFGMLPEEKRKFIEELQQNKDSDNRKREIICYIGDGTNDGPALAQADIGVSIASRSDTVALKTAHIVLMHDGISQIPMFLNLGKRSGKTITMNVVLALGINVLMIVLAAYGFLSPALGAVFHQAGMVAVVLNSARLAIRRKEENYFEQQNIISL
jgi:Cd2+/Zn2+-exporting ATPase